MKKYFGLNVVWNETIRILRRFSKDYFQTDVDRSKFYTRRRQGAKCKQHDISDVIYYKLSHGAASYTLNGENVNVMLEFRFFHVFLASRVSSFGTYFKFTAASVLP